MKVQKALHLYKEMEKVNPRCIGQEYCMLVKYDGWYGYADYGIGDSAIKSRAGRTIPSVSDLSLELSQRMPSNKGRLIFEIIVPNLEFATLNGILNRKREQAIGAVLMVHDWIPDGGEYMDFIDRYNIAAQIVHSLDHSFISMAPIIGTSKDDALWKSIAAGIWESGGEGLILKRREAPYHAASRNYDLMKIKLELTVDLVVVGVEPGKGKYEDTLGALRLADRAGTVHTVSGMSDSERDNWWRDPESILGRVVEVKAMQWLPDGQLREPRFICIRYDKELQDID